MRISIAMALASVALYSAGASAQYDKPDRRFYIAPQATYLFADSHRGVEDTLGYSLSLGKTLGRGSNLELSADLIDPDSEVGGDELELRSYGIGLMMFPSRQTLPWYILARIGRGESRFTEVGGEENKAESDQFDIGLGYLLGLGNWPLFGQGPALRVDARYRYDKYSAGNAAAYAESAAIEPKRSQTDYLLSVGLQIPLGPDPNAAQPVKDRKPDEIIFIKAVDSDGDQVPDDQDQCPNTPSGTSVDARGCPWDGDGDGVADPDDRCPGTRPGLSVDAQGCAPDGDNDGVLNVNDACPNTPAGAAVLADGCAPAGDCRLPRPGQAVDGRGCAAQEAVILKGVNFATASDQLTPAAKAILKDVAQVLKQVGSARFEVAGHTDNVGGKTENRQLSERRAISVKRYLVELGVPSDILSARGYGETQPLRANSSEAGRAENRRVELRALNSGQ